MSVEEYSATIRKLEAAVKRRDSGEGSRRFLEAKRPGKPRRQNARYFTCATCGRLKLLCTRINRKQKEPPYFCSRLCFGKYLSKQRKKL